MNSGSHSNYSLSMTFLRVVFTQTTSMSRILLILCFLTIGASTTLGQTRTVETRTEIDSATGQRRTVSAETVSTSEDITPRSNMLIVNPLKFFWMYNLSYYRRLNEVVVVGGGLQTPTISGLGGFGANAEIRFHPSGKAMRGFYAAPNVSYNLFMPTYDDAPDESVSAFSVGGLLGWQWFPGDDFAIGLGIGVDYYFLGSSFDEEDDQSSISTFNGTLPAIRFDIGYAW